MATVTNLVKVNQQANKCQDASWHFIDTSLTSGYVGLFMTESYYVVVNKSDFGSKWRKESSKGSSNSTISTSEMQQIVEKLKMQRVRDSTRKNYYTIWKLFNQFYLKLDVKPTEWEDRLTLFIAYLINDGKQSQTVRCYVSSIRAVLQEDGVKLNQDEFILSALTRACKIKNDVIKTRLPIRKNLLKQILYKTREFYLNSGQIYLMKLYTALFASAYYGLFRVGEITSGSHPMKVSDVQVGFNKKKLKFTLRMSKTHGKYSHPQIIKITSSTPHSHKEIRNQNDFCPYEIIRSYCRARPGFETKQEPFFIFSNNSSVTPGHMRNTLCTILKECGKDPALFGVHSFRIGRSQDLLKLGVSVETIKKIGRWKSNTV